MSIVGINSNFYLTGLTETLEVEVRSKFQTARRMRDASRGVEVEVPFDNALVRYLWVSERELRVTDVSLYRPDTHSDTKLSESPTTLEDSASE